MVNCLIRLVVVGGSSGGLCGGKSLILFGLAISNYIVLVIFKCVFYINFFCKNDHKN